MERHSFLRGNHPSMSLLRAWLWKVGIVQLQQTFYPTEHRNSKETGVSSQVRTLLVWFQTWWSQEDFSISWRSRMSKTWFCDGYSKKERNSKQWLLPEISVWALLDKVVTINCSAPFIQHPSTKCALHRYICIHLYIFQFLIFCSVEFGQPESLFLYRVQIYSCPP